MNAIARLLALQV